MCHCINRTSRNAPAKDQPPKSGACKAFQIESITIFILIWLMCYPFSFLVGHSSYLMYLSYFSYRFKSIRNIIFYILKYNFLNILCKYIMLKSIFYIGFQKVLYTVLCLSHVFTFMWRAQNELSVPGSWVTGDFKRPNVCAEN